MSKGRPRSNSDEIVVLLYTELAMSVDEIAGLTRYSPAVVKQKLQDRNIYDPPLTTYFVKKIWDDWTTACNMIRNANCRGSVEMEEKNGEEH